MGLRYRKSVHLFPGCRLNISRSGLSISLGVPGATVNLGRHGTTTTVGIPGSGLSYSTYTPYRSGEGGGGRAAPMSAMQGVLEVKSASTDQLTSSILAAVQDIIVQASRQRAELYSALVDCRDDEVRWTRKLGWKRSWLGFLLFWAKEGELAARLAELVAEREGLQDAYENSCVDVVFEMGSESRSVFRSVQSTFEALRQCHRVWDITGLQEVDRVSTRSAAGGQASRVLTTLFVGEFDTIKQTDAPVLANKNGGDLMVLPGFLLVKSGSEIGLIDYEDVEIKFLRVEFTERKDVPKDARVTGTTWNKVNANGKRDRRFTDNFEIPVCDYGILAFESGNGLQECWMFSDANAAENFANALIGWQAVMIEAKRHAKVVREAPPAPEPPSVSAALPAPARGNEISISNDNVVLLGSTAPIDHRSAVLAAIDEDYLDWCLRDLDIPHANMPVDEKVRVLAAHPKVVGEWLLPDLKIHQLRAISSVVFGEVVGRKQDLYARILAHFGT